MPTSRKRRHFRQRGPVTRFAAQRRWPSFALLCRFCKRIRDPRAAAASARRRARRAARLLVGPGARRATPGPARALCRHLPARNKAPRRGPRRLGGPPAAWARSTKGCAPARRVLTRNLTAGQAGEKGHLRRGIAPTSAPVARRPLGPQGACGPLSTGLACRVGSPRPARWPSRHVEPLGPPVGPGRLPGCAGRTLGPARPGRTAPEVSRGAILASIFAGSEPVRGHESTAAFLRKPSVSAPAPRWRIGCAIKLPLPRRQGLQGR